ncbi:MAG: DUF6585 family protein [Chloroflexota bacterium]
MSSVSQLKGEKNIFPIIVYTIAGLFLLLLTIVVFINLLESTAEQFPILIGLLIFSVSGVIACVVSVFRNGRLNVIMNEETITVVGFRELTMRWEDTKRFEWHQSSGRVQGVPIAFGWMSLRDNDGRRMFINNVFTNFDYLAQAIIAQSTPHITTSLKKRLDNGEEIKLGNIKLTKEGFASVIGRKSIAWNQIQRVENKEGGFNIVDNGDNNYFVSYEGQPNAFALYQLAKDSVPVYVH